MKALAISKFETFVKHQAVRYKGARVPWISVPTHRGFGFDAVLSHEDGVTLYGEFVLLAATAANMERRGVFARHGEALSRPLIARFARISSRRIDSVVDRLLEIGWLEEVEITSEVISETASEIVSERRDLTGLDVTGLDVTGLDGTSLSESEKGPGPGELAEEWNRNRGPLPEIRLPVSSGRERHARARLAEVPDLGRWSAAIARLAASPFATGRNDRGWKADFDFLLRPDTLARIEEGKYDDRKPSGPSRYSHLDRGDV